MSAMRRFIGQAVRSEGAVIDPKTLATVPVLPDGQIAVVTDQPGNRLYVREGGSLVPAIDAGSGFVAKSGDTMTGRLVLPASAAVAGSGLRAPHGVAPDSPQDGDVWTTDAGMFVQVDGSTVGPLIESETELYVAKSGDSMTGSLRVNGQVTSALPSTLTPTGGDTIEDLNFNEGNLNTLSLASATGDVTVEFAGLLAGGVYAVKVVQGATARDILWPASVKWRDADIYVPSTGSGDIDLVSFVWDGTNALASYAKGFA